MLELSRQQILAQRRRVSGLNERLTHSSRSLERAAFGGLQDSMPRAAQLSIHARVSGIGPDAWQQPPLVQVWGLRYSAYVIAQRDLALFTIGRLSENPERRQRAEDTADRLEAALADERMDVRDAARLVGLDPNKLRYAAPTGRFLIYWDGARQPLIWSVPAPDVDPVDARLELLRRHLHVFGIGTFDSFASWAGLRPEAAAAAFESLKGELIEVQTPIGEAWILAKDESALRSATGAPSTRLLPSGDTYYLLQGVDRELLVQEASNRERLWTSRVWPGAVLVAGEIVGTWRRSGHRVSVESWHPIDDANKSEIEEEAASMPLPGIGQPTIVTWVD
ncbi:MAG TPA: crosslink repair DNA glycosylase YcaQ family protein [Acidimicrobiia bacterium]|nr:crosslink repair DNA glycosylase YcaQ family protein [Acidimicrobiia bacterium]